MKKLFLLFGLLVSALNLSAENKFYINDMTVRPGEVAHVTVMYHIDENDLVTTGYTLFINVPDEITPYYVPDPANEDGFVIESENGDGCEGYSLGTNYHDGTFRFLAYSPTATPMPAGDHSLVTFAVKVADDVAPGTVLTITPDKIDVSDLRTGTTFHPDFKLFNGKITVAGKDDASTFVAMYDNYSSFNEFPQPTGTVDVRVYRSFKAGHWSTIVVPFDMNTRRIKAAFGDDAQVADFVGWETSDNGNKIDVKFEDVEAMTANTPYIIKVSKDIDYFYVNGVQVNAKKYPGKAITQEEERDTYTSNFYGSYFLDKIPANNLFIQDNLFYYSTGNTNIKGFRGFFKLYGASANANIGFMVNDEVTSISDLQIKKEEVVDGDIYSISGQNLGKDVDRLHRGVYIVNGKKYVKK